MEFEWDQAKSERNRRERGFAFADIISAFTDPHRHIEPDDRFDYGEPRFRLYGRVAGRLFVITYTDRAETRRIISARKANDRERKRYGQG
jgi:uncharacterized DUF497 family protein